MRRVGDTLKKEHAERFARFLISQGIDAESREDDGQTCNVWVFNEDQLSQAEELYESFKLSPNDNKFNAPLHSSKTPTSANRFSSPDTPSRARHIDVRSEIFAGPRANRTPVTISLIVLSVIATLASSLPAFGGITRLLYFSETFGTGFTEILNGQVWRLVTPIFLHSGIWHLLFNMMWVYQLGGAMENHEGSRFLLAFTVLIATLVNCAEYMVTGPLFIGMSGVVYAMLGYAWIMSRHEYNSPYDIVSGTTFIMIAWLVLCLIGVIPGVANTQHVVGLLLGGLVGLFRSRYIANWLRQARRR